MKNGEQSKPVDYPLSELCVLADLPVRTVRYYIQIGLVDRPEGETRAARYGAGHLEQLLLIKKWTAGGVSLERIRDLLRGKDAPVPPPLPAAGTVTVRSHLTVADGIELVIDPGRARLTPETLRRFVAGVMAVHAGLHEAGSGNATDAQGDLDEQT
ncbi:MerR family transcriptional regulator [Aromatoleum evansii]|uniref:MerR family transcriptional regulator n=1 Tax=Aromatoleum evansii TaxID=59406 RepID=UPI00145DBB26|nr:MerR family transcriptional regulator [Aromatoleum evansii]NMG31758.1 MerR family transcriptional regulator [Aromatoleum evansii]